MKELDFDELDRAVNSLMTDTTAIKSSATDEPEEKTLDLGTADLDASKPSFDDLQPTAAPKAIEQPEQDTMPTPVKPAPAIRRSSGRFMDVVHPSSDMKQTNANLKSEASVTAGDYAVPYPAASCRTDNTGCA